MSSFIKTFDFRRASFGKLLVLIALVGLLSGGGCAWFEAKPEKNADQLIHEGMKAYQEEDYDDAIEAFQKLRDWYPFSKYAILAELKIADAHFQQEQYLEAIVEYESFEHLHPRNEAIPYVIFQTGLCHFMRIDTIDRDQTPAQQALDAFGRLERQFPRDTYTKRSAEYVRKSRESLAGHEFYVGEFYFRTNHCKPALNRFKNLLSQYPDIEKYHAEAREYIEQCNTLISKEQEDEDTQ